MFIYRILDKQILNWICNLLARRLQENQKMVDLHCYKDFLDQLKVLTENGIHTSGQRDLASFLPSQRHQSLFKIEKVFLPNLYKHMYFILDSVESF